MFKKISKEEQIRALETENQALRGKASKQESQIAYVAMMGDIDLPEEVSDGTEEISDEQNV